MSEHNTTATQRVGIDFQLPLWGVICAAGTGFVLLVGMYVNVAALTASVKDLQITVQAGNTAYSSLASRATLLEFRVENNTSELQRLNGKVQTK